MALRLAMSFLNHINEYTIFSKLREKFSKYCLNPDAPDFWDFQDFKFSTIKMEETQ